MPESLYLTIAILLPAAIGLLSMLLPGRMITTRVLLATAGPALAFGMIVMLVAQGGLGVPAPRLQAMQSTEAHPAAAWSENSRLATDPIAWMPSLNINLTYLPDGLGVFFALLVSGIGVLIYLYARGYFGPDQASLTRFYPTIGFFTSSMLGLVLADSMILTLLFWEMTSISSFLLIGWDRYDKKAVKLAMQAFFTTGFGGLALFGGLLLLGQTTGIWRWSTLLENWDQLAFTPPVIWAFVLMFLGAATKSAQWPFHYWLPGAMAAPTPVSAFLHSATMVKAGVFLVGRLYPVFDQLWLWPWLLIPVGGVTMVLGGLLALNQHDLKRIFAYTTVSQLGLLICMYGLGGLTYWDAYHNAHRALVDWDISQIANHAFYKAPLFILAGAIGHVAGTRLLPELYGFFRKSRIMVILLLIAAYAMAGGPGTISFPAKELFFYAIYHAASHVSPVFWLLLAGAVVTAACNVAIFIRLLTTLMGWKAGLGAGHRTTAGHDSGDPVHPSNKPHDHAHGPDHTDHDEHHHEHGFWGAMIWIPGAVLVSFQIIGGLFPRVWEAMFLPLEVNLNYFSAVKGMPSLYGLAPGVPLYATMLAIAVGIALGFSHLMRGAITDIHDRIYPTVYNLCVNGGGWTFRLVQNGSNRAYMAYALLTTLFIFLYTWWRVQQSGVDPLGAWMPVMAQLWQFWPGVILGALYCTAALSMPLSQTRVVRVLLLGVAGFSVVGLFLLYQAPDLALTQLMVEIISVILFVLVLRLLPEEIHKKPRGRVWRVALGCSVGILFAWMTLVAAPTEYQTPKITNSDQVVLGEYYTLNSYEGKTTPDGRSGGGRNVVNVILVDFRSFDTLGEIVVLALAGIGVWSLIRGRDRRREQEVV